MNAGTRVKHKTLGNGTVQPYIDFDNTDKRSSILKECGIVIVKFDAIPEGYSSDTAKVDIEALEILPASCGDTSEEFAEFWR